MTRKSTVQRCSSVAITKDGIRQIPSRSRLLVAANQNRPASVLMTVRLGSPASGTAGSGRPGEGTIAFNTLAGEECAGLPLLNGILMIAVAVALFLGVFVELTAVDTLISDPANIMFATTAHSLTPGGAWMNGY